MKHFSLFIGLMMLSISLFGQPAKKAIPTIKWTITKTKKTTDYLEFTIKTKVPKGWMITTENASESFDGLSISLEDDDFMKSIEIKQTKGKKVYNEALFQMFKEKVETTQKKVKFQVRIYLEKGAKVDKVSGEIEYWQVAESMVLPPNVQEFKVEF